jgi:hypothetical protein
MRPTIKPVVVQCWNSVRRASSMAAHENQKLSLPDGRVLGFAEYGSPDGYPIIFFHGWPSSRLEGRGAHKLAKQHGVRVICPDRPGFGLSTFQPGRRIADWPADVKALASHVGLSRFGILGGSGKFGRDGPLQDAILTDSFHRWRTIRSRMRTCSLTRHNLGRRSYGDCRAMGRSWNSGRDAVTTSHCFRSNLFSVGAHLHDEHIRRQQPVDYEHPDSDRLD